MATITLAAIIPDWLLFVIVMLAVFVGGIIGQMVHRTERVIMQGEIERLADKLRGYEAEPPETGKQLFASNMPGTGK